ncbi:MAG: MBL fold metallo-hydrolase [Actinomycetota bacterium]|nr:MBL fold metallo-hydrolase [Actinomycetota bacterium]MDQ3647907.1 MBL fold metallo-hydrolase [Actinomycetota bacterium]
MILQRVEHPDWLSNAYLVVDRPGGHGVLVDGNGVIEPLLERVEREGTKITHFLLTHHHADHVVDVGELAERFAVPLVGHEDNDAATSAFDGSISSGELEIEAIPTPGHCGDHVALLVNGTDCLTADVLFKGTVGGTRAPGHTTFEDLKSSIMDRLMTLPDETRLHPGHRQPTTVASEWEHNPFIRLWRGLEEEGSDPCRVGEDEATLVLWAPDYDGTNKAWVRFESGEDAVVGGSQVDRSGR